MHYAFIMYCVCDVYHKYVYMYCICAVVRASDCLVGFTDLPINFPFDFEYMKEHLDPCQFRGQRERRQILHVPNVQFRPDLVGHVERRLPDNIHDRSITRVFKYYFQRAYSIKLYLRYNYII